jgi:hypothetical protein
MENGESVAENATLIQDSAFGIQNSGFAASYRES